MAYKEPYTARDGFGPLVKGMHSGLDPLLLDSSGQYAYGVNVTTRGGFVRTRPGFAHLGKIGEGKFQGAAVYALDEADHMAFAIDGIVHVRHGTTGTLTAIDGATLDPNADHVYFTQVYRWLVAQDGVSRPIVVQESGGSFSRFDKDAERDGGAGPLVCYVPGTIGTYAHGRYHYVPAVVPAPLPELQLSEDGSEYLNEDVVPVPVADTSPAEYDGEKESGKACFVSSDVLDPLEPKRVFRMTEHRVLDEGSAYGLPAELGFVHGMGAMRGAATGTGVGSLYVFGSRGVSAFEVSSPRSATTGGKSWKDIAFSQVAFHGSGTYSPLSIVNVNDDMWYVDARKYLRSVYYDSTQLGKEGYSGAAQFNVTKSFETERWVKLTDDAYRPFISSAVADNRIHWTLCGGRAVCSLDFAQSYTAAPSEIPPIHEGAWTGFDFARVLSLNGDLHAVVRQGDEVHLLRSSAALRSDPGNRDVESFLVTKMYPLVYNEVNVLGDRKKLSHVEILVSKISRTTSLEVWFRPHHHPEWTLLGSKTFNVPAGSGAQVRSKVTFSVNPATMSGCNGAIKEVLYVGHAFQFMIKWTGDLAIDRFTAFAPVLEEAPPRQCDVDNPDSVSYPEDDFNDFSYEVQL